MCNRYAKHNLLIKKEILLLRAEMNFVWIRVERAMGEGDFAFLQMTGRDSSSRLNGEEQL
jgi:hypothetical protein